MVYFSNVTLHTHNTDAQQLGKLFCNNAYREHQELWQLFELDPDAERDFLYRREQLQDGLRFFVVSKREPKVINSLWQVETKSYHPKLTDGETLAFQVRVNPVVTRKGDDGKPRRHDVVMDYKREIGYQQKPLVERPSMTEIIQESGEGWLQRRAEKNGFSIEPGKVRIEAYQQHRASKKVGKPSIHYSTFDITGVLTVEDNRRFMECLYNGLGPAKAFGCGLLLVRRI